MRGTAEEDGIGKLGIQRVEDPMEKLFPLFKSALIDIRLISIVS